MKKSSRSRSRSPESRWPILSNYRTQTPPVETGRTSESLRSRVFERMLLQREKFKSRESLIADTYWALERFPDMEISTLLSAMESADTNNLGLSRVFARLRNSADHQIPITADSIIQAVSSLAREGLDIAGLWKSLLKPSTTDDSLEARWTQVSEIVSKIFPDFQVSQDIRQVFVFVSWLHRLSDEELPVCVELIDRNLSGVAADSVPLDARVFKAVKDSLVLHQNRLQKTPQPVQSVKEEEGRKEVHCFVGTAMGKSTFGFCGVWPDFKDLRFEKTAPLAWKRLLVESEAVEKALEIAQKEFPSSEVTVVIHLNSEGKRELEKRLEEVKQMDEYQRKSERKSIIKIFDLSKTMNVRFQSFPRDGKDWRSHWVSIALKKAEKVAK